MYTKSASKMFGIYKYIAIGSIAALVSTGVWSGIKIHDLSSNINRMSTKISKMELTIRQASVAMGSLKNDKATLQNAIDSQNEKIQKQHLSLVLKGKEIAEWKAKPNGEKYKKWYDVLKNVKHTAVSVDINKTKCERYIDVENATSGFDLDSL